MTPPPPTSEEAKYKELFQQFVATKKKCGEPYESLTFESFLKKIKANEAAVMQKTGCAAVTFRVYVKDGKAALKATPVK